MTPLQAGRVDQVPAGAGSGPGQVAIRFRRVCVLFFVAIGAHSLHAAPQATAVRRSASAAEQRVASHMDRIRHDPPALRAFLQALPKGADLHTHLGGAVYAESYIRWAADLPLCVDVSTFTYVEASPPPAGESAASPAACKDPIGQRPAALVLQDPLLYRRGIDALSTRNWLLGRAVGHDQFFDTFPRFDAVTRDRRDLSATIVGRSVAEIMRRAALQHVQHLELMLSFDSAVDVSSAGVSWDADDQFQLLRDRMLADGLDGRVAERRRWLDAVDAETRTTLSCGTPSPMPGCDVSRRFIAIALRGMAPNQVFAEATLAFELAAADPRIAGVNLVMPEDGYIPMRDYDLHMRMFRFLRKSYPGVHVALHAGELSFGLVPPEELGLHVRRAIEVGGAQRIGHGTDVMYDVDPSGLLRDMARRRIAVEICLTSSDVILGVRGASHPLHQFLRAGVPVVVATDDEGVARSDLTNEFQRAVQDQGLSYGDLKQMSRNSIEYSFLPAREKARLSQGLNAAFERFEAHDR
jgi:adenosine deaminase